MESVHRVTEVIVFRYFMDSLLLCRVETFSNFKAMRELLGIHKSIWFNEKSNNPHLGHFEGYFSQDITVIIYDE